MAVVFYPGDADARKRKYISDIENAKKSVDKNFKDMDFENASAWFDMKGEVRNIIAECNSLLNTLRSL